MADIGPFCIEYFFLGFMHKILWLNSTFVRADAMLLFNLHLISSLTRYFMVKTATPLVSVIVLDILNA